MLKEGVVFLRKIKKTFDANKEVCYIKRNGSARVSSYLHDLQIIVAFRVSRLERLYFFNFSYFFISNLLTRVEAQLQLQKRLGLSR